MWCARSGRFCRNQAMRLAKPGKRSIVSCCRISTAIKGITPTSGRTRSGVGLIEMSAVGQWPAAIEHTDVVEAEETARENVATARVLAVHPPREIEQQLLERAREEASIARAGRTGLLVDAPHRPRVHG